MAFGENFAKEGDEKGMNKGFQEGAPSADERRDTALVNQLSITFDNLRQGDTVNMRYEENHVIYNYSFKLEPGNRVSFTWSTNEPGSALHSVQSMTYLELCKHIPLASHGPLPRVLMHMRVASSEIVKTRENVTNSFASVFREFKDNLSTFVQNEFFDISSFKSALASKMLEELRAKSIPTGTITGFKTTDRNFWLDHGPNRYFFSLRIDSHGLPIVSNTSSHPGA